MKLIAHPSPNFDTRNLPISMLVLHYTEMATPEAALARLCSPQSRLSAHYLVGADGTLFQLVDEAARAWHAGVGHWQDIDDINSASIGIELDHNGHARDGTIAAYPPAQMRALVALAGDIIARHHIRPDCVLGHSDVSPDRKIDPGESFDWQYLAEHGIGLYPKKAGLKEDVMQSKAPILLKGDSGSAVNALQNGLKSFGYWLAADGYFGASTELVVMAFQRHFRPARVDGVADEQTQILVQHLHREAKASPATQNTNGA